MSKILKKYEYRRLSSLFAAWDVSSGETLSRNVLSGGERRETAVFARYLKETSDNSNLHLWIPSWTECVTLSYVKWQKKDSSLLSSGRVFFLASNYIPAWWQWHYDHFSQLDENFWILLWLQRQLILFWTAEH